MIGAVEAQQDLWAQLAALRAAQAPIASTRGTGSNFSAATTSANGVAAGGAGTTSASPMLSDGLMSQLLSFGGVPAASADGTSDTEQYTGANGVGYPGGPPPFPSQNAAGEVGADSSVPNLFASLRSLFADLAGGGSTTSSTGTAITSVAGSSASTVSSGTSSSGTDTISELGSSLLQDLQSIATDLAGIGDGAAGTSGSTAIGATAWDGLEGVSTSGGCVSNSGTALSDTADSIGGSGTSTTVAAQDPSAALMQQIAQAVAAYMQSVAGQSGALSSSMTDLAT